MSLDLYLVRPYKFDDDGRSGAITVFEGNITGNLNDMALEAGLDHVIWGIRERKDVQARDVIFALEKGLKLLKCYPENFKEWNPSNGWGSYNNLVQFVTSYLAACEEYPLAYVKVS